MRRIIITLLLLSVLFVDANYAQTPRINEYKEKYANSSNDSIKIEMLRSLVVQYLNHYPDSLPYFAKKLEPLIQTKENIPAQISVNSAYSMYYYDKAKYDSSIYYADRNIEINRTQGDSLELALGIANKSVIYLAQSRYEEAIEYLLEASKIQETNRNKHGKYLANTYNILSAVYHNLENFGKAQNYQFKSLEIFKELSMETSLIRSYTNLGSNYTSLNKMDSAIYYLNLGLELSKKNNAKRPSAELNRMLGDLHLKTKNYDLAQMHFEKSVKSFVELKSTSEISESMKGLGNVYYKKGKYKQALDMHTQAKDQFLERGNILDTSKSLWLMSKDFQKLGKYREAYDAIAESKSLNDTLQVKNNTESINEMQVKYETEKKEQELLTQSAQLSEQELKLNQQQLIRNIAIGGAIFLGLIAFIIYYIKTKSNKEISIKNEQLSKSLNERESLLKEIHHRVKNNLQIIASLLYLQSDDTENTDVKKLLEEGQGRVRSMALIHQKLYENEDLKSIPFDEYLSELVGEIKHSFGDLAKDVVLEISAKNIFFDVDTAVPLGLIINELSTNAFKYAFEKRLGSIFKIDLELQQDNMYHMTVSDNGIGIPDKNLNATKSASLGLKLTKMLSDQLEGEYTFSNTNGTTFELKFAV